MSLRTATPPAIRAAQRTGTECPICGEDRRAYLFVIRGLPVVRCPGCGLIYLSPQPDVADYRTFYDRLLEGADPRLTIGLDGITERDAAQQYLSTLRNRGIAAGRILLIAPPDHPFAAKAEAQGFSIGQHVSIREVGGGLDFGWDYDAAVILYQLEKATAPLDLLNQIHSALRPEGVLLLATPSLDSWPAHFFGEHWTEWRPENLYYFSKALIQSILVKSGFLEVWVEPDRRLYTLGHVNDRATAFPTTSVTRLITLMYRLLPSPLREARIRLSTSGIVVTATRAERRDRPLCSIVVPAYNERQTFTLLMDSLLAKQVPGVDKEIIIVESNSKDGTREAAQAYQDHPEVRLVLQDRPQGKGNAVRMGFKQARGDILMIQDADLEYDLNDYDTLLEPLLEYRSAFVLGARHGGNWKMRKFEGQHGLSTLLNLGHLFFTGLINVLYGQRMCDPFTMYKVFRRDCLYGLEFECNRFDFDHELVIKLVCKGYRPLEIPVNYRSRSFKDGKKVAVVRDPLSWLWVDLKYRFVPLLHRPRR
ncbi:MAG: glycosyltransferase [Chloroflexi bacterium]|nr:glycosyltransferase [Chloroflexota bacterium]MCL5109045.1 glycosyltransferase [Chloroflexota bacterium]